MANPKKHLKERPKFQATTDRFKKPIKKRIKSPKAVSTSESREKESAVKPFCISSRAKRKLQKAMENEQILRSNYTTNKLKQKKSKKGEIIQKRRSGIIMAANSLRGSNKSLFDIEKLLLDALQTTLNLL